MGKKRPRISKLRGGGGGGLVGMNGLTGRVGRWGGVDRTVGCCWVTGP